MLGSDSLLTSHGTTLQVPGPADLPPVEVPELVGAGPGAVGSSADGTQLYLLTDWPADPEQELVTEGQRAASSLGGVTVLDDLATGVPVSGPARRVVSLVPSLTESVATTRPEALIGATDWCTHPTGLTVARSAAPRTRTSPRSSPWPPTW